MSEIDKIDFKLDKPNTISTLKNDLLSLGIKEGMTLLVHSSLRSIGWVCGGAVSVILALEEVLTEKGSLVMPTHSSDLSDPRNWRNPPVPESWWEIIENEMPVFDKDLTPTLKMGIIPEVFRKQKTVIRSSHPNSSFAAWGKNKNYIVQDDHLDYQINEKSPLGRIYELDGNVLFIGVDYDKNTSFHLAEYKANYKGKTFITEHAPIAEDGKRVWKEYRDILFEDEDFGYIGNDYEKENSVNVGYIGKAKSKLIPQREMVDFAVKWMEKNRK
jgi:aminoglycoside 3-N-acetyltransferase